jgi:hypothetical protein
MRLKETGEYKEPISLKYGQSLFVDMWDKYYLYEECSGTSFDFRLNRYLEDRSRSINYFNANYIKMINKWSIKDNVY